MACGRLVVVHTANPAIYDKRLRPFAELFPKVFTPVLRDTEEITRRGLPSQVHFGAFVAWTAPGMPGFYDMWKTLAEFQGTLYEVPDFVTDGRLTQSSVLLHIGADFVKNALDNAPAWQPLARFPSTPQMNHPMFSTEDVTMITRFYRSRRADVLDKITQLREMTKTATEHEMKSFGPATNALRHRSGHRGDGFASR